MFQSKLASILSTEYGVGVLYAAPETILWAADEIGDVEEAKKELKKVNDFRKKWGRIPVYVPYGHRLF